MFIVFGILRFFKQEEEKITILIRYLHGFMEDCRAFDLNLHKNYIKFE